MTVVLRPATDFDMEQVLAWRNDPFILSRSSGQRAVMPDEHATWFAASLASVDRRIYIVMVEAVAAGLVRFDRSGPFQCVISAYLIEKYVGRGLGVEAITLGCELIGKEWPVTEVLAHVRMDNPGGAAGFCKAGFALDHSRIDALPGHSCWRLRLKESEGSMQVLPWAVDDLQTVRFFSNLAEMYGDDVRTLNWGSRASQARRFEVLAGIADLRGASVLDVGCGLGDFSQWLTDREVTVNYRGLDITPQLIELARARHPAATFDTGSVLDVRGAPGSVDFVFASGIFYLRKEKPFEFMQTAITRMFDICRRGVAFNSLSTWGAVGEAGEFRADPAATLEFCRGLSPRVALRHDYHPHDFTIYIYKDS